MAFCLQRPLQAVWWCAEQGQRSGSCSSQLWHPFLFPAPFILAAATGGLLWLGVMLSFPSVLGNICAATSITWYTLSFSLPFSSVSLLPHMSIINFTSYSDGILAYLQLSAVICFSPVHEAFEAAVLQLFNSYSAAYIFCLLFGKKDNTNCLQGHP